MAEERYCSLPIMFHGVMHPLFWRGSSESRWAWALLLVGTFDRLITEDYRTRDPCLPPAFALVITERPAAERFSSSRTVASTVLSWPHSDG